MVITVSESKGIKCQVGNTSILVDPDKIGSSADLVLKTSQDTKFEFVPQNVVIGPGEYEINGIRVIGINLSSESSDMQIRTSYSAKMEGMNLGFLGTIDKEVPEEALDKLGAIDILFVGAGNPHLEAKKAADAIKKIEPKVIVLTGGNVKEMMDELGQKPEHEDKLVIKQKDLEELNSKLVWIIQK